MDPIEQLEPQQDAIADAARTRASRHGNRHTLRSSKGDKRTRPRLMRLAIMLAISLAITSGALLQSTATVHHTATSGTPVLPLMDGETPTPGAGQEGDQQGGNREIDEAEDQAGDANPADGGVASAAGITATATTTYCTDWRWDIKTGQDVDAKLVNLGSTTATSIATMGSWTPPDPLPCGHRAAPVETTVYRLDGTLLEYQLEPDSDIHLRLTDGAGHVIIVEIPNPVRVPATSPFLSGITTARNEFYAALGQPTTCIERQLSVPVHVRGVGFWDYPHVGGSAPNAIELHPVLDVQFGSPATTPTPVPGSTPCPIATPWPTMTVASGPSPQATPTSTPTIAPPSPTRTPSPVAVASPTATGRFSDGFESGTFGAWSTVVTGGDGSAVVQTSQVKSGSYAAQLAESSAAGSLSYIRKSLAAGTTQMTASGDIEIRQEGVSGSTVPLLRLFDATGARLVSLYRPNLNNTLYVQHSGGFYRTSGVLPLDTWGHVTVSVVAAGAGASTVEAYLNGALIYRTTTASVTSPILTVQIGNEVKSQTFSLIADNIAVSWGTSPANPP